MSAFSTDDLQEGTGNLYYENSRVLTYLNTFNKGYFFSTTSATFFADASTTIAKTYSANTFTAAQIFDNITRSTTTAATSTSLFSTKGNFTNLCISGDCKTAWPTGGAGGNSKWATSSVDSLSIHTNSATNVGIGTTTPKWALQIASSTGAQLSLSDPSSLANNHWSFRNAGGNFYLATSSASTFATSSDTSLSINGSTGNVGIGIADSIYKFQVTGGSVVIGSGSDTNRVLMFNTADSDKIYFTNQGVNGTKISSESDWLLRLRAGNGVINNGIFAINTGDGERMRITSTGNVGIGNSDPLERLHVTGNLLVSGNATATNATTTSLFSTKGNFTNLCISGDCKTAWPAGGAGGNSKWATSTNGLAIYTNSAEAVVIGATATSSRARLTLENTLSVSGSTSAIAGLHGLYTFNPSTADTVQVGNRIVITNSPGASVTNTAVGEIIRMIDDSNRSNLVRGLEVVASAGSNPYGVNTGIRATGHTFGIQGITTALAGGTSTPAAIYGESTGTTQGDILRLYTETMTTAPAMATLFQQTSTFSGTGLLMDLARGGGTFNGNFVDFRNNEVSKFSVASTGQTYIAGNLGIGNVSPAFPLQVQSGNVSLAKTYTGVYGDVGFAVDSYMASSDPDENWRRYVDLVARGDLNGGSSKTSNFRFFTQDSAGNYGARMFIAGSGNVGIGTTSPQNKLHVYADANNLSSANIWLGNPNTGTSAGSLFQIGESPGGGRNVLVGYFNQNTSLGGVYSASQGFIESAALSTGGLLFNTAASAPIKFATNNSLRMTITSAGDVGIGTDTPDQQLTVAKGVAFLGVANGAGTAYLCTTLATGVVSTSTTACNPSSARFKDNVEDLSYGLSDIMNMRAVSFDYKPEMLITAHQIGFIAEELANIAPEVVGFDAQGLVYNVDYSKLTPILVKAIQELNLNLTSIADMNATSTSASSSFASNFFENLFSRVTTWLADAANGIGSVFANTFHAKESICIDGECLTKDDIRTLLDMAQGNTQPTTNNQQPTTDNSQPVTDNEQLAPVEDETEQEVDTETEFVDESTGDDGVITE